MRKIIYLFVFATALLIVKAFFLDDYIAQYKIDDTNASIDVVESNTSNTNPIVEEKNISNAGDANASFPKKEKLPLEHLGDELTKHIKL